MTWLVRATLAASIVGLLALAAWTTVPATPPPAPATPQPVAAPTVPPRPTDPPTPRPTATRETIISRLAREVPTFAPRPTRDPTQPRVAVLDFSFDPYEIRVRTGATVVWTNEGVIGHDVTDVAHDWGSGNLGQGARYSRVFVTPGSYNYYCTLHPTMRGRVIVSP